MEKECEIDPDNSIKQGERNWEKPNNDSTTNQYYTDLLIKKRQLFCGFQYARKFSTEPKLH